jgi:carboxylesterase
MLTEANRPFFYEGGNIGCLLLHGFSGAPGEMHGLGDFLHRQGFTVLGVRLFGHGTPLPDLNRARWQDWVASAEDGYYMLRSAGKRVVVVGMSMGASIALYLASRLPAEGIVALSSISRLPSDMHSRYARVLGMIRPLWGGVSSVPPDAETGLNTQIPLRAFGELDHFLQKVRESLPKVTVPVRFIHSHADTSVSPRNAEECFNAVASATKDLRWLNTSGHIITEDVEREQVWRWCAEWVRSAAGA